MQKHLHVGVVLRDCQWQAAFDATNCAYKVQVAPREGAPASSIADRRQAAEISTRNGLTDGSWCFALRMVPVSLCSTWLVSPSADRPALPPFSSVSGSKHTQFHRFSSAFLHEHVVELAESVDWLRVDADDKVAQINTRPA